MRVWTYGEVLDLVESEFDLVDEDFVGDDEMVGFFNRALQIAGNHVRKLGVEDEYFQDEAFLALVDGASDIALPTRIHAHKIREIVYANGSEIYEVLRMRRRAKFVKEAVINREATSARYRYKIKNAGTADGAKIVLIPPARETSSTVMKCYYHREVEYIPLVSAGSLAASRATKIDLPACQDFIQAYVMYRVAKKVPHPDLASYKLDMEEAKRDMIDDLTGQVDDDHTEIPADVSHYEESS